MFWLLSAKVLYGFAMLLIGVLRASGIGHALVPHPNTRQMIPQLRHGAWTAPEVARRL